jgi:type IV fimbrial biogenesis protein FimT/type IV fimbrial biogenesis protein FimU
MMTYIQRKNPFRAFLRASQSAKVQGFTLVELMVAIAVVAIISTIAMPSLNNFMVNMRVDNEITELQRLLLTARNMAINTGKNTTVCPLSSGSCTTNWQNEISVFTNGSNDVATNNTFAAPDELVKVKGSIKSGDQLEFDNTSVVFAPSGRLITAQGSFSYCPKEATNESRGIDLSVSGRSYLSSDTDNDGKDENREGTEIVCS